MNQKQDSLHTKRQKKRPAAVNIGIDAANGFSHRNIGTYASSIAFFMFIAMIPILILLCALLPYTGMTQNDLIHAVTSVTPDIADGLITSMIVQAYSKSSALLPFSIIVLVWAASQATLALIRGLNDAYRVEEHRNYFKLCLISIFYTVIILIYLFVLVLLIFSDVIIDYTKNIHVSGAFGVALGALRSGARYFVTFILGILFFALLYTYLPAGKRKFILQIPGALIAGIAWLIFSGFFSLYVNGMNRYTTFYGSLATIAILMFWMFCCFYILLVGGFVNSQFAVYIKKLSDKCKDVFARHKGQK